MKRHGNTTIGLIVLVALCVLLSGFCALILREKEPETVDTLSRIKARGTLRVITQETPFSYFTYRSQAMGFDYDLAALFAAFTGVDLEILTPGRTHLFSALENFQGDLIAASLPITDASRAMADFSTPILESRLHLIHHRLILKVDSIYELDGREIHVPWGSPAHNRLKEIRRKGVDIVIVPHKDLTTRELLRKIQDRSIKYVAAYSQIALRSQPHFPDIVVGLPLNATVPVGWAVRKGDTALLEAVNQYIDIARKNSLLDELHDQYMEQRDAFDYYDLITFHDRIVSRLPEYREIIMQEAELYSMDWRLIAAVVYQESHFDPWAESPTGVRGLMQVTEDTAREMGIVNRVHPEESIRAGIKYLHTLYRRFEDILDPYQRMIFTLASYNIGYGHVRDAQEIAISYGKNRNEWYSLKQTLPLLSQRNYYKKTTYGYARGRDCVRYVERVLRYYDILMNKSSLP